MKFGLRCRRFHAQGLVHHRHTSRRHHSPRGGICETNWHCTICTGRHRWTKKHNLWMGTRPSLDGYAVQRKRGAVKNYTISGIRVPIFVHVWKEKGKLCWEPMPYICLACAKLHDVLSVPVTGTGPLNWSRVCPACGSQPLVPESDLPFWRGMVERLYGRERVKKLLAFRRLRR